MRHDDAQKYDLDSDLGQRNCKSFLESIERLFEIMNIPTQDKSYRLQFSKAYKVLYKDGQSL